MRVVFIPGANVDDLVHSVLMHTSSPDTAVHVMKGQN